jgi:hypothetical protein
MRRLVACSPRERRIGHRGSHLAHLFLFQFFAFSSLPSFPQRPVETTVVVTLALTSPDPTTVRLLPPTLTRVVLPLPPPPTETGAVDMREEVAAMAAIALEDTEVTEEVMETEVVTVTGGGTGATVRREGEAVDMPVTEVGIGAMEETEVMNLPGVVTVDTVIAAVDMTVLQHPTIVTGLPLKRMWVATRLPVAAVVMATTRQCWPECCAAHPSRFLRFSSPCLFYT